MTIRYNMKKIMALAGVSASLVLVSGCGTKDRKMVTETVREVKDTTCFDEIISEEVLKKVDLLEEYLRLSKLLHTIKFERAECSLKDCFLYSPEELKQLIAVYTSYKKEEIFSKMELRKIEDAMNEQERLVNQYIYEEGYSTMEQVTMSAVKAKLLDTQGLDEDSYASVVLPNVTKAHIYDVESFYFRLGEYKLSEHSNFGKLYKSVYEMQQQGDANASLGCCYEYNKDRNYFIGSAIENLENTLMDTYEIDNRNVIRRVKK